MSSLDLPERLLLHLDKNGELDTYKFATEINENHQKVVGAVKCLEALGGMITTEPYSFVEWFLTAEGKLVSTNGSHEAIVYQAIPPEGITKEQLAALVPNIYNIGLSKAMVNGWIYFDKTCASGKPLLKHKVDSIKDIVKEQLLAFEKNPESINVTVKNEYKKRKLIQELTTKGFKLGKGENFTLSIIKPETDLTPEMIASGSWKDVTFKPYNFNALGAPSECGALHPLLKVREQFRQIFLEMGFTEMATNNYVESSFWNFDALFQPQQHPARDAHDTFFVAEPKSTNTFPQEYLERVKQVHSTGGFGSQGYGYDWKYKEAQKNLLRTHTTAVSAKMLYALAQKGFTPAKYFSIDRVFRNETLDATHLAEFHQVEGVVADYNLTLGDLIGTLHEFFNKLGLGNLHFKPAYNPYTEPSMEIFSYHPGLDKFIEVGNSGVFRPEMLLPMGLPANVNVIAWGLSLERPTMIKYGFNNIRSLVGPKVDLEMVQQSPLCRLDKVNLSKDQKLKDLEDRLASAVQQLRDLQENFPPQEKKEDGNPTEAVIMADPIQQLSDLQENFPPQEKKEDGNHTEAVIIADPIQQLRDLQENFPPQEKEDGNHTEAVIIADPHHPPFSLIVLLKLLGADSVSGHVHLHSSVVSVPPSLTNLVENIFKKSTGKKKLNIKFVWNADCKTPKLFLFPFSTSLMGEVTIARYLNNWVEMQQSPAVIYKTRGAIFSGQIDSWLDLLHGSMVYGDKKKRAAALRQIDAVLGQRAWLIDSQPTIADICWWSLLKGLRARHLSSTVRLWVEKCNGHKLFALE